MVDLAKARGMAVFLIGHSPRKARIAGPKLLEHLVDTVLRVSRRLDAQLSAGALDQEPLRART